MRFFLFMAMVLLAGIVVLYWYYRPTFEWAL